MNRENKLILLCLISFILPLLGWIYFSNVLIYTVTNPVSTNRLNYIFLGGIIHGLLFGLGTGILCMLLEYKK